MVFLFFLPCLLFDLLLFDLDLLAPPLCDLRLLRDLDFLLTDLRLLRDLDDLFDFLEPPLCERPLRFDERLLKRLLLLLLVERVALLLEPPLCLFLNKNLNIYNFQVRKKNLNSQK